MGSLKNSSTVQRWLVTLAAIARYNLEYFWVYYFNSEVIHLRAFLNQFGGTRVSVDFNTPAWSGGPATDLKQAMCQETVTLYALLTQVLDDLEFNHAEMARVWREFALSYCPNCEPNLLARTLSET